MMPNSVIEINLSRLDRNLALFRGVLGDAEGAAAAVGQRRARPALSAPASRQAGASAPAGRARGMREPPGVRAGGVFAAAGHGGAAVATARPAANGGASTAEGPGGAAERPPLICGVVKADAYGLGAPMLARRLALRGIDMLAVYSTAQAEQIVGLGIECPLLVMQRTAELSRQDPLYRPAMTGRLHLSIHDRPQLIELDRLGRMFGCRLAVHLAVDTGMSRAGMGLDELPGLLAELPSLRHVRLAGVYTHLASSESDVPFTDGQMARLDQVLAEYHEQLPGDVLVHVANTAAALRDRRYHRDMIRIGLGLYGYGRESMRGEVSLDEAGSPEPTLRWVSRVIHVRRHGAGTPVGYNSTYMLRRASVLGVVPAGYADGYPLGLSGQGAVVELPAYVREDRPLAAPVLGRVNMDQIVVDLTDAPAEAQAPGQEVLLVSDDPESPCALPRLAKLAGSSTYELLTRLSPRLPRKYVTESRE